MDIDVTETIADDTTPPATEDTAHLFTQEDLDRARTQASKTAYENARKKMLNDEDVEKYFKERFEQDANMTAEQKYQAELEKLKSTQRELAMKESRLLAKQTLVENGFTGDSIDSILDFVTSEDTEKTEKQVANFLGLFNSTLETKVKEKTQEIVKGSDTPRGGGDITETSTYKQKLDSLAGDKSAQAQAESIALMFEAQSKGIQL